MGKYIFNRVMKEVKPGDEYTITIGNMQLKAKVDKKFLDYLLSRGYLKEYSKEELEEMRREALEDNPIVQLLKGIFYV